MKPGIVGRTGGGKSTFVQVLFHVVDLCTGQILIDGILSYSSMHKVHAFLSNHCSSVSTGQFYTEWQAYSHAG